VRVLHLYVARLPRWMDDSRTCREGPQRTYEAVYLVPPAVHGATVRKSQPGKLNRAACAYLGVSRCTLSGLQQIVLSRAIEH
jgi:hypothetical protein